MKKVIYDIKTCIEKLEGFNIHDPILDEIKGRLRRSLVEVEGLENIWNDDMPDFEKACIMLERGFDIDSVSGKGVVINYLGYHLWNLTDEEVELLTNQNCETISWKTNWRCFREFSLTLKRFVPNNETIKFAWCRLKVVSDYEKSGFLDEYISRLDYPDMLD